VTALAASLVAGACGFLDPADAKAEAVRRGDELVDNKEYAQAIASYLEALERDPRDGTVRLKLSNAYLLAGNGTDAVLEAIRAADLLPDDQDAQATAASMMLTRGRFVDATDRASAVLDRNPEHVKALVVFGSAKARLFNSTYALHSLAETLRLGQDYRRAIQELRKTPASEPNADEIAEAAFSKALALSPTDFDAQLSRANFLWAVNRADDAEQVLRQFADENPQHHLANRALGMYYLARGRQADGEKYLKVAAEGGEREARLGLADYYARTGRSGEALAVYGSMGPADDNAGAVTLPAAEIEVQLGRHEQAVRRLEALLEREPLNARALALRGRISLALGDLDQAVKYARTAAGADPLSSDARAVAGRALDAKGDTEGAFSALSEALRLDPGAASVSKDLARLALALGRDQEALQFARQAARLLPDDRDAAASLVTALVRVGDYGTAEREIKPLLAAEPASAQLLAELGAIHAARNNTEAARSAFTRALQTDRHSFGALSGLVLLDLMQGQVAGARERIDGAIAAQAGDPRYLVLAARVYSAGGDLTRAESTLRRAAEIDASNPRTAVTLSDFLAGQKRHEEAKQVLEQFVERRPESVEAQTSLGMLLEQMGRNNEAKARYERIVASTSGAAVASYRLASLYAEQGDNLNTARGLAVAAKQALPDDPAVSDALGWVYVRQNLPKLGIPHLQDAVRAVPGNPAYRYHLGFAYLSMGDRSRAREELTRALQLDSNFAFAREARTALALAQR
jgi:tetratricopeptide (TPR) repeat protein